MMLMRPLFTVLLSAYFYNTYSQQSTDNFLRDYKAPDFSYRSLIVNGSGRGDGLKTSFNNVHNFSLNGTLNYYQIKNSNNYQGTISSFYNFNTSYLDNDVVQTFQLVNNLSNTMQNRFYIKDRLFIGAHDQSSVRYSSLNYVVDSLPDSRTTVLSFKPAVSFGFGRVEWVQFARQSLDIERSLLVSGRLDPNFSDAGRTTLADKIAVVNNRRFFDNRFGRIEQLQALDSLFGSQGWVTNSDIIYFTQLQDAYLYSHYVTRLSGFRAELGISQGIDYASTSGGTLLQSFGFFLAEYHLPQSYAIQHDFRFSVLGGLRSNTALSVANDIPAWVDLSYTFGLYPTTRTYLGATLTGGAAVSNTIGYIYGGSLDAYFWISPRLRFSATADTYAGETYTPHGFNHVAVWNQIRVGKQFDYSFRLGLSFAIL